MDTRNRPADQSRSQKATRTAVMQPSPRIKNSNAELLRLRVTALPARVSLGSREALSSHIDSAGRSRLSSIGSGNNIPTCRLKGRGRSRGLRDIHKGASRGRDGREQSVRAQLDGLWRGGVRVAECAGFSKTKRGTQYLILKASTEKKLLLPAAVDPPRIHLHRQSTMHNETITRVRIRVRIR